MVVATFVHLTAGEEVDPVAMVKVLLPVTRVPEGCGLGVGVRVWGVVWFRVVRCGAARCSVA